MEYSWFVAEIRKNQETADIEHAVDKAIDNIPDDFQIRPFLLAHRSEVQGMLLTEYNEVEAMELFKEDGRAEERVNTEIQKKRADDAEKRADDAEKRAGDAENKIAILEAQIRSLKGEA